MKRIHITNGEAFNAWFVQQNSETSIPFCEAMLMPDIKGELFSSEFMEHRSGIHHVSLQRYLEKIRPFLTIVDELNEEDELVLWFGTDAFCQMNLLTVLEFLIQKKCSAKIQTVLFDENQPWHLSLDAKRNELNLHKYKGLYETVLVHHQKAVCEDDTMNQGIELFLDLINDDGRIMTLIRNSLHLNENELMKLVMSETEKEGLSDVQALYMIERAKRMSMKRALFVIDYQNDFVDGTLGFAGAELLDEKIASKIREYGKGNVWFTRDTHFENYLETREGRNLPVVHCIKGTKGWEVYGETAKALEEVHAKAIDKLVFGMDVSDPAISSVLPESLDEIELVGLVSNICVVSNAAVLQSKYPEATIIVDASCTDSFDKDLHEKVLDVLAGFQVKVINRK